MNIKKISMFFVVVATPIISSTFLISCSSSIDQNYIDKFYSDIVSEKKEWKNNENVYASSVYNLETFRSAFRDQLPTDKELSKRNFKMEIINTNSYDSIGKANFRVYLKNLKTGQYYPPTPTKINESEQAFTVIDFSVSNFLKSTPKIENEFNMAYDKINLNPKLTPEGNLIFNEQNIETYFSLIESDANWLGKAFEMPKITGFNWSSFYNFKANNTKKIINVEIYLKDSSGKTKGPAKLITLIST